MAVISVAQVLEIEQGTQNHWIWLSGVYFSGQFYLGPLMARGTRAAHSTFLPHKSSIVRKSKATTHIFAPAHRLKMITYMLAQEQHIVHQQPGRRTRCIPSFVNCHH